MCSISGCENPTYIKSTGLCSKHYNRLRTTGTTDDGPRARMPLVDRFWKYADKSGDCWEWKGPKNHYGYGTLRAGGRYGKTVLAHRLSWELHNGEIPEMGGYHGAVIRHSCDNRGCVNPHHLEIGTQKDNVLDMDDRGRRVSNPKKGDSHHNGRKTHCINGHEFNDANTYTHPRTKRRYCKVCKAEKARKTHKLKRGDKFGLRDIILKSHCNFGHEYTVENTYVRPDGYRECRICRTRRVNEFKHRKNL